MGVCASGWPSFRGGAARWRGLPGPDQPLTRSAAACPILPCTSPYLLPVQCACTTPNPFTNRTERVHPPSEIPSPYISLSLDFIILNFIWSLPSTTRLPRAKTNAKEDVLYYFLLFINSKIVVENKATCGRKFGCSYPLYVCDLAYINLYSASTKWIKHKYACKKYTL